jgi:hypothetical protein
LEENFLKKANLNFTISKEKVLIGKSHKRGFSRKAYKKVFVDTPPIQLNEKLEENGNKNEEILSRD